jgi:hypothetical protein
MNASEGRWAVIVSTPIGTIDVLLTIWHDDHGLRGTARSGAEVVALRELVADGAALTWKQDVTHPLKLTLAFAVAVQGDLMTGTAKAGFLPASKLRGERVG